VPCLVLADRAVDDSSPLVQRRSRLHVGLGSEGSKPILPHYPNITSWDGNMPSQTTRNFSWPPAETKSSIDAQPRAKKAYDTGRTFMGVVREMQHKWKVHKEEQMKELEPWKYKKHMAMKEAYRNKMKAQHARNSMNKLGTAMRSDSLALNSTQRLALENEAKIAKYGEQMTLIVKDLLGHELEIRFRTLTKLGVLTKVVCKRLGLQEEEAKFVHRDRELQPKETPGTFGLVDGDIIEVTTPGMQAAKVIKEEQDKQEAIEMRLRAKREKAESKASLTKATKKARKAKKVALESMQLARDASTKKMGMNRLKFVMEGKPIVDIRVKRQNWLGGAMDLVCKRLGLDRAKTVFLREVEGRRKPIYNKDTVDSLNLEWGETITVKAKAGKAEA